MPSPLTKAQQKAFGQLSYASGRLSSRCDGRLGKTLVSTIQECPRIGARLQSGAIV